MKVNKSHLNSIIAYCPRQLKKETDNLSRTIERAIAIADNTISTNGYKDTFVISAFKDSRNKLRIVGKLKPYQLNDNFITKAFTCIKNIFNNKTNLVTSVKTIPLGKLLPEELSRQICEMFLSSLTTRRNLEGFKRFKTPIFSNARRLI